MQNLSAAGATQTNFAKLPDVSGKAKQRYKHMTDIKRKLKKEDFDRVYGLYPKQSWLCEKESSLIELIELCDTAEHKDLIIDLLSEFKYLDQKVLNTFLNYLSDCIINDSGFTEDTTIIASITADDSADSSQKVLDYIKVPLFKMGWSNVTTVNRFNDIPKHILKGKTQIILIDEFIGSGKTIHHRLRSTNGWPKTEFKLKFCFLTGMNNAIQDIENLGYEVFCPLRLPKGISERYDEVRAIDATVKMNELENKLAQQINTHNLSTFSMGYNDTQALYSLESCLGNTPNSVFPLFWWPKYSNDKQRNTLLTRVEKGLR